LRRRRLAWGRRLLSASGLVLCLTLGMDCKAIGGRLASLRQRDHFEAVNVTAWTGTAGYVALVLCVVVAVYGLVAPVAHPPDSQRSIVVWVVGNRRSIFHTSATARSALQCSVLDRTHDRMSRALSFESPRATGRD